MAEATAQPSSPAAATALLTMAASSAPSSPPTKPAADEPSKVPSKASASSKKAAPLPSQQYVDHSYTDYANVDEDDLRLMREAGDAKGVPTGISLTGKKTNKQMFHAALASKADQATKTGCTSSLAMPFPGKLVEVLDRGDLSAIIDWMPHGRAFIVKQPKLFTSEVLPRFFKQTKFLSFTRQLNLWGFKRITRGLDAGAYYHELFLPGHPNLAMRMRRLKVKGTGIRPIPNPAKEPNFYYDYPHVPKVVQTRPIPLPPLPHERIAMVMGGPQPVVPSFLSQPSGPNTYGSALGTSLGHALSEAALAEHRLYGVKTGSSALLGAPAPQSALNNELASYWRQRSNEGAAAKPESALDMELYRRRIQARAAATLGNEAPRNLSPLGNSKTIVSEDAVSSANRRLIERLLEQPSAPAVPEDILQGLRRSSYMASSIQGGALFQRRGSGTGSIAAPPTPSPSSNGSQLLSLLGRPSRHSLPMAMPSSLSAAAPAPRNSTTHSIAALGVNALSDALREARHLEDITSRRRAMASELASALQQRMGYPADVQDLLGGRNEG